jgi:hypothetical protein
VSTADATELLRATDPELAKALEAVARQSLVALDAQALAIAAEQDGANPHELMVARSSVARARRLLSRLEARLQHARAVAFTRRMGLVRGEHAHRAERRAPVQLVLFVLEAPPPPRPPVEDLPEADAADVLELHPVEDLPEVDAADVLELHPVEDLEDLPEADAADVLEVAA